MESSHTNVSDGNLASSDKRGIQYFTVYGERCSGTNFLTSAIEENFNLEFTSKYTWKHFFGHYKFENNEDEDNTLFIGIVRNPITWIDSFYKTPHHIPNENTVNIHTFISNSFYSIYSDNKEIIEDRHILTNEKYNNIFELRYVKNNYLITEMKKNVLDAGIEINQLAVMNHILRYALDAKKI